MLLKVRRRGASNSNTSLMEKRDKQITLRSNRFRKSNNTSTSSSEKTQSKLFGGTRKIEPTRFNNVEGIEGPKFAIARGCSARLQPLVVALNDGKYPASRLISCKHSRLLQLSALKAPGLKRYCKASVRMADGSPSVLYCDS